MAKTNPFQQFTESITKPIGGAIRGVFRGLAPGMAEQHDLQKQRIADILKSEEGQRFLRKSQGLMNEARARSLDRGEGYYGGRGIDPMIKGSEDLGKIRAAKDKFSEDEISPEIAAYFNAAEKSVLDRMKSAPGDNRELFAPQDETDVFEELGKKKEYEAPTEWLRTGEVPGVKSEKEGKILADYFQAPTDAVPESNIPKTYPQLGIESVDDQATLEEMQNALPDVDMKGEYEADPELMKKLMELWRAKKLTKQNLHKAFSMMQTTAQQALGIG